MIFVPSVVIFIPVDGPQAHVTLRMIASKSATLEMIQEIRVHPRKSVVAFLSLQ